MQMLFFSVYLNIRGLQTGPGKFIYGCPGKSWIFCQ